MQRHVYYCSANATVCALRWQPACSKAFNVPATDTTCTLASLLPDTKTVGYHNDNDVENSETSCRWTRDSWKWDNTHAASNNGERKHENIIENLPPGTEQIVHFWHRALRLGGDTLCIMLVGFNSPLPPISRCSKWRSTHSLRRGIHWVCAVTSASRAPL